MNRFLAIALLVLAIALVAALVFGAGARTTIRWYARTRTGAVLCRRISFASIA